MYKACTCKNRVFARKRLTKLVQSLYLQKLCFCTRSFVSFVSFVWLAKRSFARSFAQSFANQSFALVPFGLQNKVIQKRSFWKQPLCNVFGRKLCLNFTTFELLHVCISFYITFCKYKLCHPFLDKKSAKC